MDPIVLIFYGILCGLLCLIGPKLGTPFIRFGTGAAVGLAAAALLPMVRASLGF